MMENRTINAAIQVVPLIGNPMAYQIVDECIAIIQQSGLHYEVGPFETAIDGTYEQIIDIITKIKNHCLTLNANEIIINTKMSFRKNGDALMDEKINKYM